MVTKTKDEMKKVWIIVTIVVVVLAILGIIGGILIFYRTSASIEEVSYTLTPTKNGISTYIELTVKTKGGSLLFGAMPHYNYVTYFGCDISCSGNIWRKSFGGEHVMRIGPFNNGTEVWIIVAIDTGDKIDWRELTVRINHPLATPQDRDLRIENVTATDNVLVRAKINGTTPTTSVEIKTAYFWRLSKNTFFSFVGSGGGSLTMNKENDTYSVVIDVKRYWDDYCCSECIKEGIFLYRVIAFDEHRTVCSSTYSLKI